MPAMDFALTEQQELIRKEVSALARSFPPEYWLERRTTRPSTHSSS
jgi:hypothetical protein